MQRNYETFRQMLYGAICNRTQAQFALESGISAEHLSRMLNMEKIYRPNRQTLAKIASAAKNGITLQDLTDALDQDDGTTNHPSQAREDQAIKDFAPEFETLAENTMQALCNTIALESYPLFTLSITEYIERLVDAAENGEDNTMPILTLAYEIGQDRKHFGHYCSHAERYMPVWLSMADTKNIAESIMMVYFNEIPCGENNTRYVIQEVTCKTAAIEDQYGTSESSLKQAEMMLEGKIPVPAWLSIPKSYKNGEQDHETACLAIANELPYDINFSPRKRFKEEYHGKGNTAEEQVLSSIFGEQHRWPETIYGLGFTISTIPEKLASFLSLHKNQILADYEPEGDRDTYEELEKILSMDDSTAMAEALDKMEYNDSQFDDDEGWQSAVALVMRTETGFPFRYHAPAENIDEFPGLSQEGCILLEEMESSNIQRETMLNVTCRYAKQLGIHKFGDMLFTGVHTAFIKPMTYTVKNTEPDETKETENEEPMQFTDFDKETSRPGTPGMYMTLLKDGRQTKLLWIEKPGVWIRAHKEWSSMVEKFCPEPIPADKNE